MDLANRCGRQRCFIHETEHLRGRSLELTLDDIFHELAVYKINRVLQLDELGTELFPDDVRARRHELPHFDERRAELDHLFAHPYADVAIGLLLHDEARLSAERKFPNGKR